MKHTNRTYHTADLDLATYLRIQGHVPTVIPTGRGKQCEFHFPDSPELQQAVLSYVSGSATVPPMAFSAVRRELSREIDRALSQRGGAENG